MTRRRAIALLAAGLPLAVLLLLCIALYWLLFTRAGFEWAADSARPYLPDGVAFEQVEGRLAGPLAVTGIEVEASGTRVGIARLELDWRPRALLGGTLRLQRLAASEVEVALPAAAGPDAAAADAPVAAELPSDLSLPFAVEVREFLVESLTVHVPGTGNHHVQRFRLRAAAGPDGLVLRDIELAAPLADVEGRARVAGIRPFAVDAELDWRLRPPDPAIARMAGRLALSGSLGELIVRLAWDQPHPATLEARASLFGESPRWSAEARLPVAALRDWWRDAPALAAGADLQGAGSFEQADLEGRLEVEGLITGPLQARLDASASATSVRVDALRIDAERHPGMHLRGHGSVDLAADEPRVDATATWRGLRWPLTGAAAVQSDSGELTLRGTAAAYELAARAVLITPETGPEPVEVELDGSGSSEELTALQLQARWHAATLTADGRLRWSPAGSTRLQLELSGLNPGRVTPALSGRIGARGTLEASWDERVSAALELASIEGELGGQDVTGSAALRHADGATRVERLVLTAGAAQARVSGRIAETLDLDWRLDIPSLQALVAGWEGRIEAEGQVAGAPLAPRVRIRGSGDGIVTPAGELGALGIDGTLAPLGGAATELRLGMADLVVDAVTVDGAALHLSGTPAEHRLELALRSDLGDADLRVDGGLDGSDWSGRLVEAALEPEQLGRWRLAGPVPLRWRDGRLDADPACWRRQAGELCLAAAGTADEWEARLRARQIPVGLVASTLRDDLEYSGTFELRAQLSSGRAAATGRAVLELSPGKVRALLDEQETTLIDYGAGRVVVDLGPEAVEVEAGVPLVPEGAIRLDARIGREPPRTLAARLQADVGNLGLLSALTTAVGRVEGRLLADIELGGTVDDPTAAGDARLEAGRIEVVPLGIQLTGIRSDLATAEDGVELTLAARSGGGELKARARIELGAGEGWRGSGTISGTDFRAVDLPEVEVAITPELEWQLQGRDLSLTGRVEVPQALIAPRDLSGTVQTSPDAVVVGEEQRAAAEAPLRVDADLEVVLGPDVRIDAFGLDARLEGSVRIREQPGALATGTGELRVAEGTYRIYRQTLEIERGRVIFDGGPVANPGLDIRAVRRPRDVVVGVNVRGTLRDPRVQLFSTPAMEESQQLSYLIAGLPLRETSSGQQSAVAAAATALARSEQGSELAGKVGIQQVTVDRTGPGQGASIVLGRYLSPRLYVGYGIGLMEQANSVRMRYELTDHWNLEARSGLTSSADLLYSIEVDSTAEAIPELPEIPVPEFGRERRAVEEE